MEATTEQAWVDDDEMRLRQYGAAVLRYKWLVLAVIVVGVLAAFAVTLRTPKVYESSTTLLIPKEGGGGGFLSTIAASGLIQQIPGLSIPSLSPNRDVLLSILKSRTLADAVIERLKLQERYRARFQDPTSDRQRTTTIALSKEGLISVKVEDADPLFAAEMANYHVEELNRLVVEFGVGEASHQRVFIAGQLPLARRDLQTAEESLLRFQQHNRVVVLQEQTQGAIAAAARLKGEIMAAEVQLAAMRHFATEANWEFGNLKRRVDEMKRQLAQMQYGDELEKNRRAGSRQEIYVPFAKVPEVGLELARLTRDVKVQEALVTFLTQQLEQARISEAKQVPIARVLDPAIPATIHSKPSMRFNLVLAAAVSSLVGVFLAIVLDHRRKAATAIGHSRAASQSDA